MFINLRATRREQFLGARALHQSLEALCFGHRNPITKIRQTVIASSFIVELRIGALLQLLDQTVVEHALDRTVQRPWSKTHFAFAALVNLAHDLVTMPVF